MRSLIQASDTVFSNPSAYKGTIKPEWSDYVAELLYNAHYKEVARLCMAQCWQTKRWRFILEWTKLVCTPASTALFACPGRTDYVQVRYRHIRQAAIPARVVLGTAVLQNRLPSLIISAILAQYSSLCDHLVLQFNLG